ncbi:FxsA family protein [Candidatus Pelagibacter sp.]|nr:FxsA family protein [Candidatus Pelagibacter sp.]
MNAILLTIILIPAIEIYLFIEIGGKIGALYTISLIFLTAVIGVYYAKYEGFNTLKSGMGQLMENEIPIYEIVSGAALAFAALLLIIPGFATDLIGFLMIFPPTRKLIFSKFSTKISKEKKINEDFIEGESEDIDDKK